MSVFTHKIIYFTYKSLGLCIKIYICLSAAPLCYLCFEEVSPDVDFDLVFGLLRTCPLSFCSLRKSNKVFINQKPLSSNTNTGKANQNTSSPGALGGAGPPLGKTLFLHCQRRHPELSKLPTYLPPRVRIGQHT